MRDTFGDGWNACLRMLWRRWTVAPALAAVRVMVLAASCLCLNLLVTAPGAAQEQAQTAQEQAPLAQSRFKSGVEVRRAFRSVVQDAGRSTVRVLCDGRNAALGAVVAADGWIVTKASELQGQIVCRLQDGREFDAELIGLADNDDLALLKIEATDLPTIQWSDATPTVGQWAVTAGQGDDPAAVGIVSVPTRRIPPRRAIMGVLLNSDDIGPRVMRVFPQTGAAVAGLRDNDVIVQIAEHPTQNRDQLVKFMEQFRPGQTVRIKVLRGDTPMDLEVTLMQEPADPHDRNQFQNHLGGELSDRNYGFESAFQHDTVLNPSDCGGPLVGLDGRTMGINIARAGRTESYAVPAPVAQRLIAEMRAGKYPPPDKTMVEHHAEQAVDSRQ